MIWAIFKVFVAVNEGVGPRFSDVQDTGVLVERHPRALHRIGVHLKVVGKLFIS